MSIVSTEAKRILIVRVGAMGDVLHALPAVAALKQAQPSVAIDWIVDERWLPLLAGDHGGHVVRRAIGVPIAQWKKKPLATETLRSFTDFRTLRGQYDLVVDMQGTLRSAAIGRLAGGRSLAGYADPRERAAAWLYGHRIERVGAHVVAQGAALLGTACEIALQPIAPELPHQQWADDWATELVAGRKLCVLAPRAGWAAKQWPAERFGALAKSLHDLGYACVLNASRQDDPLANEVVARSGGAAELAVCNVAGLVALVRRAALLVAGDSGPMHLAATLGVPVVALFGPTDPARNGPWGPGPSVVVRDLASVTSYRHSRLADAGLANVTVERVLEAVHRLTSHDPART